MKENLNLMRQAGSEGLQTAAALPGRVAMKVATLSQQQKAAMIAGLGVFIFALNSGVAFAVGSCGGGDAANALSNFIGKAALFLMAIGGASALLMFTVGALYIIFATSQSKKGQGMNILKNAVIGLIVLGVGVFVKYVVLQLIIGATGSKNTANGCVNEDGGIENGKGG